MESLAELKKELTDWIDQRIKTGETEANTLLMADLDTRFAKLENGLNDLGTMMSQVSKDVGGVADSVSKLFESVLAIPQSIVDQIDAAIGRINPFHLP